MDIPVNALRDVLRHWRPGIAVKLFLAFLLSSLILLGSILGLMQWSLGSSFRDYLRQSELRRLDGLVASLGQGYAANGHWDWLRHKPRRWERLLAEQEFLKSSRRPPPLPPPRAGGRRPPPPPPPRRRDAPVGARLGLVDAQGQHLIGLPPPQHAQRLAVHHRDQVVGWLTLAPQPLSEDQLAMRFLGRQTQLFLLIGAVGLLFAALAAALLARHLLGPVQTLAAASRALTAGRFETRVGPGRHDELGALARDFDQLAATLEDNEKARRRWVADISHELRTPLAVLRGELEAVEDGVRPWGPAALASLQGEVARLHKLVDDLYELARSELGGLAYRKASVDLTELLEEVLDSQRARLQKQGIRLTQQLPTTPVVVYADRDRLRQLFANLVNNTLAYTDPEGELRISCQIQEIQALVDFQDTAPGVPTAALPRLFERLYRVDASRNRARGGSGLGLAICHNIVQAHDGEIHARASPLGGLWVQIQLPLDDSADPGP